MPSTVNGIGTHYYGKKNLSVRSFVCGSCGRAGQAESYDTRLWFVIFFIPVIPLGRKRIIDKCPFCTRHIAAAADAYEQARQLQTSDSLERYRREPSVDAALEAHGRLLAFRELEQAAQFRAPALARFPDSAELRVGFAAQLQEVSVYNEAAELYEDALDIEPDLPQARVGVAMRKMAEGELDEARALLDFLEVPGAAGQYPIGPLDVLSVYYQGKGRHEEAIELAAHVLRELPEAGQQHKFRAFVRKSEKALGREESILPPREHSLKGLFRKEGSAYAPWQRWLAAGGAGAALLSAGLMINNEYIRRHRTIHVLNATGEPVQVRVDDEPPRTIKGRGALVVSEGRHRVRLSGPVEETRDVDIRSGFFDRWSKKPFWMLNPGGEAVLDVMTIHYAANPRPSERQLMPGQPYVALPHVDYPFEDPPPSLDVGSKNGEVTKIAVEWAVGRDAEALVVASRTDPAGALAFAERRLRRTHDEGKLLRYYLALASAERPRVEALLKSGLDIRPVLIQWHRAYQLLVQLNGDDAGLVAQYDRYAAAEPSNAAILYLRGRIEPDWEKQAAFLRRSIAADPKLGWPWLALGRQAEAGARWDECLRCLRKARELNLDEQVLTEPLQCARLATGDAQGLVNEHRSILVADTTDPGRETLLCEALAAAGQAEQIEPALMNWQSRVPARFQAQVVAPVRATALYQAGKLEECERLCRDNPALRSTAIRAQALLALGRAEEVAADGSFEKAWDDPWAALAVGLGLQARPDEAARWRERAARKLATMTAEWRRAGQVLEAAGPTPIEEIDRLMLDPEQKALMLAVLAGRFPARKAEYLASAARFDVRLRPPHHLLRRVLAPEAP